MKSITLSITTEKRVEIFINHIVSIIGHGKHTVIETVNGSYSVLETAKEVHECIKGGGKTTTGGGYTIYH